ncbi:Bug family tripartite tricarboxylate transporter substrate binding protein [Verminephrobacter eiseniae]|uniref:Bug family tripartite tricarboxylate transporter substrate binding protein n=1 Tax=Verminephrobacter eiseniae TaxID=364317 RepID=UPI0022376386|nr:tripartite tricarboxylate transporter substrate binding protein [Verminephrobacter eiseniae]MCW5235722.1 tripartite tricarboxylate transporter substrate binding protein [Verminephrobacter eiseniae]
MWQCRRRFAQLGAAAIVACLGSAPALAAEAAPWPSRPITLIVPFPPGGMTDVVARRMAKDLQHALGQSVVVDNRAGASGQIGTEHVYRAAPDGYTLLVSATHHVINPALRGKLPYDTRSGFTPLALLASTPNVLVVNKDVPVANLPEFIAYARKQPGGSMFGSSSIGGATHLSGELLRLEAGIPMTHVPYKGASPALADLLAGQIPALFHDVMTMAPYVRDGRVKALGVTSATRSSALPEVPTIAEQGLPGYQAITWIGFYGPAHLPSAIAERLNALARASVNSAAARPWFKDNGADPGDMDQKQYAAFVAHELGKWKNTVARAGVTVD